MISRLTRSACVAAALALSSAVAPPARADGTYVRDLSHSPAEVQFRHSGRQGGLETPEYYGREMVTGDFNHDGRADLAVGADSDTAPGDRSFGRGFVYVYFGKGDDFPAKLDPAERLADCRIYGEAPFGYFGQELAVGDFDGDGLDDLAVSQIEGTTVFKGAVFLISGATIATDDEIHVGDGQYISKISGRTTGTRYRGHYLFFGFALAAADFNGDGVDDVAAGALGGYGLDGERPESGDVEIFLGRRAGWPKQIVSTNETADAFVLGRTANTNFGTEVAAGDVDGDGRPELLVATFGSNGPDGTRSFAGDVSVYSFARSSPYPLPAKPGAAPAALLWDAATTPPSAVVWGALHGSRIGSSASDGGGRQISVGDVDGDGMNDVVLGSPFHGAPATNTKSPGAVYVVWGDASLTRGATVDLAEASNDAAARATLLAVGGPGESLGDTVRLADFDGDGREDVIAGAPDANDATGYVAVFAGRPRSDLAANGPLAPDAVVRGPHRDWRSGDDAIYLDASFAGRPVLAVGAPYGGYVPIIGRGYAGQIDAVLASDVASALPPEPSISIDAAAPLAPGERREIEVRATAGSGTIVSLTSPDLPDFATIAATDAASGLYTLALRPSAADRGVHEIALVAAESDGRTATRRVRVTVGYAPVLTSVTLKMVTPTVFRLTVDGTGFASGEALVSLDGFGQEPVKFPAAFAGAGGVSRRVTVTNTRIAVILRPGHTATVRVLNPREGLVSAPLPVTR
jgi:hypothetical protein